MAKIMLVEDDNNLREIYGERLMAEGYEIVSAGDGEEALAIAVREKPDLIISDVMMPKISGFDMLDILRQTPETKFTKVVMMTALGQTEDKERADRLGADKYLVKSQVTLEDVAHVVHELIYGPDEAPAPAFSAGPETAEQAPAITSPAPVAVAPVAPPVTPPVVAEPVAPVMVAPEPVATVVPTAEPATPVAPPVTAPEVLVDTPPVEVAPVPAAVPTPAPVAVAPVAPPVTPPVVDEPVVPVMVAPEPVQEPAPQTAEIPVLPETPTGPVDPAVAPDMNSVDNSSSEDEMAAITKEIEDFANQAVAEANEHQEPLVTPEADAKPMPEVSAPSAEVVAAAEAAASSTETTPAAPDPSVPNVGAGASEPASVRKKVITPINDPTESPDINKLFEEELAKEAASVPGTGQIVAHEAPEEPVQPLVQVEARDIVGLEIADEDGNPIPPGQDEPTGITPTPVAEVPKTPPTGPDSIAL